MSKNSEKSDSVVKTEEKSNANLQKEVNLLQELNNYSKTEVPFLDWKNVKEKSIVIVELKRKMDERFAEGNVFYNNKQQYMRFALPSSLKTQLDKFEAMVDNIFAITYLGVKISNTTGNEYHSFIVKMKVGNYYFTTNQYLEGKNLF